MECQEIDESLSTTTILSSLPSAGMRYTMTVNLQFSSQHCFKFKVQESDIEKKGNNCMLLFKGLVVFGPLVL